MVSSHDINDHGGRSDGHDGHWTSRQTDKGATGISISVYEVNGARTSTETRPKNMRVVYIMKIC